ncbi:MAG: hypothetical protein ACRC8A_13035 [Microcoleaceae cyanobacterium]
MKSSPNLLNLGNQISRPPAPNTGGEPDFSKSPKVGFVERSAERGI